MSGSKEAMCAKCAHLSVCKYKEDFLCAQEAIDQAIVPLPPKDDKNRMINLRDIHWIAPVQLKCNYFYEKHETIRNML